MKNVRRQVLTTPTGLFVFIVIGLALVLGVMWQSDQLERTDPAQGCGGPSLVALEFAGDAPAANRIVDGWTACTSDRDAIADAKATLRHDSLGFVPAYVAALAFWLLYGCWASHRPRAQRY